MKNLMNSIFLSAVIFSGLAVDTWCVPGINPDGSLNREVISKFYFDGDFEAVITSLESFRKDQPDINNEDLIFMYKHLSVVYASNPDTKDKGESYMYQLLKLIPTVDLIDMYISDNIESIFIRVKDRYKLMEEKGLVSKDPPSETNDPIHQEPSSKKKQEEGQNNTPKIMMWTLGGVVLAGIVTYFVMAGNDDPAEVNNISNY